MPKAIVNLAITSSELLKYYQGKAQTVLVKSTTGQNIQFPAAALRSLVTSQGVNGQFELHFTSDGKLIEINRL